MEKFEISKQNFETLKINSFDKQDTKNLLIQTLSSRIAKSPKDFSVIMKDNYCF